jgi:RNA polymerase sigma factor (sigma-70 family)
VGKEATDQPRELLDRDVAQAKAGDRDALERVVRAVQRDVYAVALRFLWHPQDAEDATQEVLIRVVTGLGGFRGDSAFRTWVYRIACNTLLTLRKKRMEERTVSFDEFAQDLERGLSQTARGADGDEDRALLLEEVKIGCTLAMLLCLDRDQRLAYILGDVVELDHHEASEVLEVAPATYRKRLSRARAAITSFMSARCGLANASNACRCHRRLDTAVELGRVDPARLLFAVSREHARHFPQVLAEIRRLEATQRAAALYKSHQVPPPSEAFVDWLRRVLDGAAARSLS